MPSISPYHYRVEGLFLTGLNRECYDVQSYSFFNCVYVVVCDDRSVRRLG